MTDGRIKIEMPSERAAKEAAKLFVEYDFCTHVGKEKKSPKDSRYSFYLEIWKEK